MVMVRMRFINSYSIWASVVISLCSATTTLALETPDAESSPCGSGFGQALSLGPSHGNGASNLWMAAKPNKIWGAENVELASERSGDFLRARFPEGSINPRNKHAPRGGMGFRLPVTSSKQEVCLRYRVRFPDGFAFARGGKLPGLYGGNGPTGGAKDRSGGFSARLMWTAKGVGVLYLYAPGQQMKWGEGLGRGRFTFSTGRWIEVAQHLIPGPRGKLRLFIDGVQVVEVGPRALPTPREAGLLMSTFFGGNSPSWRSPRDQHIDFASFTVWLANKDRLATRTGARRPKVSSEEIRGRWSVSVSRLFGIWR